jgi:UDP-GlcNAc:undecaprenyl-phosphate GlcNAc-1-phosphate transferase
MPGPQFTLYDVLHDKWWIAVVAFIVAVVLTPIVRLIAYRTNVVDRPDDLLKPHARPTPYMGGVAMNIGLLAGLGASIAIMPDAASNWAAIKENLAAAQLVPLLDNSLWNLLSIALASTIITFVGLLDDIREITPMQKIGGQLISAVVLLVGGVGHRMAIVVLYYVGLEDCTWLLIPASMLMLMATVICACNATNLLDGLDGLCGGVTGIIALGFLGLGIWLAVWAGPPGLDALRMALCLAMAGAVLGFLVFNMPPASIFMGDAGSMLLGLFVATMMALFCQSNNPRWFIASCVVFALPILDTSLAVVRRFLTGQSIFSGDRSHLYDQLVDRGMTVRQVVGLFYLLAAGTAVIGVAGAIFLRIRYAVPLYIVLVILVWVFFHKLGMIRPPTKQSLPPQNDEKGTSVKP